MHQHGNISRRAAGIPGAEWQSHWDIHPHSKRITTGRTAVCPGRPTSKPTPPQSQLSLLKSIVVNFNHMPLQICYESNLAAMRGVPAELRRIRALIATHNVFKTLEGPHSPRVHEALALLLLPELRVELRQWLQCAGAETDPAIIELREQLSQLTGERLEHPTSVSHQSILAAGRDEREGG